MNKEVFQSRKEDRRQMLKDLASAGQMCLGALVALAGLVFTVEGAVATFENKPQAIEISKQPKDFIPLGLGVVGIVSGVAVSEKGKRKLLT